MRFIVFIFCVAILFSSSCSYKNGDRMPSSLKFTELDLVEKSQFIIDAVATREINPQSCNRYFEFIEDDLENWLAVPDFNFLSEQSSKVIEKSRLARNYLEDIKESLVVSCHENLADISKLLEKTEELASLEGSRKIQ